MDTDITARDLLMLSLRLMLIPTFSMVDMDMDTLDTVDTMDTHMVDMPTMDKLYRHKPYPAIANGQINVFFFSEQHFSVLGLLWSIAGN